jgi:ribonuclease J
MTSLRITPLGGVGRFGRNCLLVQLAGAEGGGPALIVDCGARFVGEEAPGFDVGLPDLERIAALGDRLLAYVITHGHEDHIGGLPYAARENNKPITATRYTARLIARRFERCGDDPPHIDVVAAGDTRAFGPFTVSWVNVSHSIPDATAVVIRTPIGTLVHSGDFRVDDDPVVGLPTDLAALTRAGDEGVLCLLADSTGALIDGRNPGERSVWPALREAVEGAPGRVAVALFASHVQRLALIAEACRVSKRRLCLLGAGLRDTLKIARELELFIVDDVLVDERDVRNFPRERIVLAVTGSQGEPSSALARLARGEHPMAVLEDGDRVVLSARVIPGNELKVMRIVDALAEQGLDIVDGRDSPHVSGHGYSGDLEMLLLATRPRTFVALHGNARHLLAHAELAATAGVDGDRVVDVREGSTLVLDGDGALQHVPSERAHEPMAAYGALAHFPRDAIAVRRRMGSAGVLVVTAAVVDGRDPILSWRGVGPELPPDVVHAVEQCARATLAAAGTEGEAAAVRAMARLFWRGGRPPPEIVLVPR